MASDTRLVEEVQKAVKKLKNNKSPGKDEITGEMIKHGGPHLIEEIHQLCNKAWKTGIATTECKKSVLVLLHKKGSAIECSNYRTIALRSHLGKVLMMIPTERLRSQIQKDMADEQAGLRKDQFLVGVLTDICAKISAR